MRLEDICKVFTDGDWIESKDQSGEGIRLVQTGNIGEGKFLEKGDRAKYISEETFGSLKCTEIFPGDILVSRLPEPVGRACIIPEKEERMITAVDCTICRPDENMVLKEYLCYFMQSEAYYIRLMNNVTGTTRKRISRKNLGNVELDIPDKETQAVVVKNLDILSRIIDGRKEELDKLDELIKARFVELFGNPVRNSMEWDTYQLDECLERIDNGKSFVCSDKPREDNYPAVLKLSAATYGDYRPSENKALLDEKQFVESAEVHAGDLLFTRKNTPELVGMAAYVQETPSKLMMPDLIFRLVPNEKMNAVFLWQLINCKEFRPVIQAISGGSAKSMSNISKERLGKIKVICPPRELQDSLVPFIKQVDKSKVA